MADTGNRQSEPTSSSKGKIIGVVITIIGFGIAYFFAYGTARNVKSYLTTPSHEDLALKLHEMLVSKLLELNKDLPKKLDEITTFDKVTINGTEIVYHYTLDVADNAVDMNKFKDIISAKICSNNPMRKSIESGASYRYEYSRAAPQTGLIGSFSVSSCN